MVRKKATLLVAALVLSATACGFASEGTPSNLDWPHWRGPTRDGIAPAGPKLLDTWPKEGPPLVWKSGLIRGFPSEGGMSSPVVAEGKVIIYSNSREIEKPVAVASSKRLKEWGWVEDMPEELSKKVEAARNSKGHAIKSGVRLNAIIDQYLPRSRRMKPPNSAKPYEIA